MKRRNPLVPMLVGKNRVMRDRKRTAAYVRGSKHKGKTIP
jgi:hypothetical protein